MTAEIIKECETTKDTNIINSEKVHLWAKGLYTSQRHLYLITKTVYKFSDRILNAPKHDITLLIKENVKDEVEIKRFKI